MIVQKEVCIYPESTPVVWLKENSSYMKLFKTRFVDYLEKPGQDFRKNTRFSNTFFGRFEHHKASTIWCFLHWRADISYQNNLEWYIGQQVRTLIDFVVNCPFTILNTPPHLHACFYEPSFYNDPHSHLGGPGPPALVSHAEAAQALSLGDLVISRALVLPPGHRGRSFLLQLRQMLHAAVHLKGHGPIIVWSVNSSGKR